MANSAHRTVRIVRFGPGASGIPEEDDLVVEEPLEIRVNGEPIAVTMRTPGEDDALAVGFLVTEGVVKSRESVWDVKRCGDPRNPDALNIVEVVIPENLSTETLRARSGSQRYSTSSCGLCGRGSIEALKLVAPRFDSTPRVDPAIILSLPNKLRAAQSVFTRTGGLHAAGLFTHEGELLYHAEDVGRHNAVDKAVGKAILSLLSDPSDLSNMILMVSGRAGFEIVQKALAARIPAVCSVSAPSSLAVELAEESGMLLIGFLRGETMNVYAGIEQMRE